MARRLYLEGGEWVTVNRGAVFHGPVSRRSAEGACPWASTCCRSEVTAHRASEALQAHIKVNGLKRSIKVDIRDGVAHLKEDAA